MANTDNPEYDHARNARWIGYEEERMTQVEIDMLKAGMDKYQDSINSFLSSLTVADHLGDVWDYALVYLPGAEEFYEEYEANL